MTHACTYLQTKEASFHYKRLKYVQEGVSREDCYIPKKRLVNIEAEEEWRRCRGSRPLSSSDSVQWPGHGRGCCGFGASTEEEISAAFKDHISGSACFCPLITNHKHTANYSPKRSRCFQIDCLPSRLQYVLKVILQNANEHYVLPKWLYSSIKLHFWNFFLDLHKSFWLTSSVVRKWKQNNKHRKHEK